MTPTTVLSVPRIPRIADDADAMEQLTEGLMNTLATLGMRVPELERAYQLHGDKEPADPPGTVEWSDQVEEPAVAEIAPAVAALLQAAIEKRLPWTSDDR
jgi:hypothetical protein